jgi:hypothetical protein
MAMVGGKGSTDAISVDTAMIVQLLRPQIEEQCTSQNVQISKFEPVSQRLQVVAGVNRFVKVCMII